MAGPVRPESAVGTSQNGFSSEPNFPIFNFTEQPFYGPSMDSGSSYIRLPRVAWAALPMTAPPFRLHLAFWARAAGGGGHPRRLAPARGAVAARGAVLSLRALRLVLGTGSTGVERVGSDTSLHVYMCVLRGQVSSFKVTAWGLLRPHFAVQYTHICG